MQLVLLILFTVGAMIYHDLLRSTTYITFELSILSDSFVNVEQLTIDIVVGSA